MNAATPQRIGPYVVERLLGRGGMATVFVVRDEKHDRRVALKMLSPEASSLADAERFAREVRLAAGLQHPHLCPVYDSGEEQGQLWFTMPLVSGESLRARLEREPSLPLALVRRVVREAAHGLHVAHSAGVVHRDIKPENILLTSDSATLVADFGIARRARGSGADAEATGETLTMTGLLLGTPAYMSPEQLDGRKDVGPASDQYALALVAYEMLAGRHPFALPDGRVPGLLRSSALPPPLSARRSGVAPAVDSVLARAIAADPAERYSSIVEFADALDAALAGGTATADSGASGIQRLGRRLTGKLLIAGLVVAVAIGFAALRTGGGANSGRAGPPRLAVLPFANLGAEDERAFAEGVSDAVRARLASASDLEVLARATSRSVESAQGSALTVAGLLAVEFVLAGSVLWSRQDSQVVVTPELIRATGAREHTVWSERIVGRTTNVFELQELVAERVARAMHATLSGTTDAALAVGTRNLDAYEVFLQGERESLHGAAADVARLDRAVEEYTRAVTLDPRFGLAWSRLAWGRTFRLLLGGGDAAARSLARATVDSADRYAPNEGYTWLAKSILQSTLQNRRRGLAVAHEGLRRVPNDAMLLAQIGTQYLGLGVVDSAIIFAERALRVDGRDAAVLLRAGQVYNAGRVYARADSVTAAALALHPGNLGVHLHHVRAALGRGDTAAARQRVADALADARDLPAAALSNLTGGYSLYWLLRPNHRDVLMRADSTVFGSPVRRQLVRAQILANERDTVGARREAAIALSAIVALSQRLAVRPAADGQSRRTAPTPDHATVAAITGSCDAAHELAAERAARDPETINYLSEHTTTFALAVAYTWCGDRSSALDKLEYLLTLPGGYSGAWLAVDPHFAPLRTEPRFVSLARASDARR